MSYTSKTTDFPFQAAERAHYTSPARALWWEPGLGKSKAFIDIYGELFDAREVETAFLLAPNNLHRNFIEREVPRHLGYENGQGGHPLAFYWRTDKSDTKWQQEREKMFLEAKGRPTILSMSYDGIMTERGRAFAKALLTSRRCLYGLDEAQRISNPAAARTVRVLASAPYAPYRRTMTGTPVGNRPWDVHTQMRFLKEDFWHEHGLDSIESMKAAFGIWEKKVVKKMTGKEASARERSLTAHYNRELIPVSQRTTFQHLKNGTSLMKIPQLAKDPDNRPIYNNLGKLRTILEPWRSRVLKKDVVKDLPDQLYSTVLFNMTPEQEACYASLRDLGFAMLGDAQCTAGLAITILLRLQQIACGYLVQDATAFTDISQEPLVAPFSPNPKIEALVDVAQGLPHQFLVWARFRADINQILGALEGQGITCGRYDGAVSDDECFENENRFHRGDIQALVLTHDRGSEGLTLIEAQTAIHYSSPFKLLARLQAEGRPHRIGQKNAVNNIDLVAAGTVEEEIVNNLVGKFCMASEITGDAARQWLHC